ncbi:hypothetical protein [Flavivirga algicola]|uniref:Uncharacterized protein n=1 Tax=Flavivirga algicola TaxID=2729136 RepID=A0ABX1RTM1_9FLAO|nr:hypothetical protein [Flavivirga algicola]NMH86511.1 hypothetical protein [Flavivirga algicola]
MKKLVAPITMFLFGIISFAVIMIITHKMELDFKNDPHFWFYRVLTALAAASISISIPGMISLNNKPDGNPLTRLNAEGTNECNPMSLLEKEPTISASSAIAVLVWFICLIL